MLFGGYRPPAHLQDEVGVIPRQGGLAKVKGLPAGRQLLLQIRHGQHGPRVAAIGRKAISAAGQGGAVHRHGLRSEHKCPE